MDNKNKIAVWISLITIILLLFSSVKLFSQDISKEVEIIEELFNVYYTKGEEGLVNYVIDNKNRISFSIIEGITEAALRTKSQKVFKMALIIALVLKDNKAIGYVYYKIGEYYRNLDEHKNALKAFNKSREYYLKTCETMKLGHVYLDAGVSYFHLGQYEKALNMYEDALICYITCNHLLGQGNVNASKGDVYYYSGDHQKALELYKNALNLYMKGSEPHNLGLVYFRIGDVYLLRDNYIKALEMYEKALIYCIKAKNLPGQGDIYQRKAKLYALLGNFPKAIEMYDRVLPIYQESGSLRALGLISLDKGDVYLMAKNFSKALEMYYEALSFFEKADNLLGQGKAYKQIVEVLFFTLQYEKALDVYDKSFPILIRLNDIFTRGLMQRRIGDIYYLHGCNECALYMYGKALTIFREIDAIDSAATTLFWKARLLNRLDKKDDAFKCFEEGRVLSEKVRRQTGGAELKKNFMEGVYSNYEDAAMFMLENRYNEVGFTFAESIKARIFLDKMVEGFMHLKKGISPELKQKRDNLVSTLSFTNKEIAEIAGKKDEEKLKELKEKRLKVEREFEDLLVKIRLENPLYASIQYPEPVTVKDLQRDVLKQGELLLRCFVTADKTFWFLISKKGFKVIELKVKEKDIQAMVNRYLIAVSRKDAGKMIEYGKKIYQAIFKPLEASLNRDKDIIIVPDRQLATIPFESFVIDDTNPDRPVYLLEKYQIKYIQSASVLATLRKHYSRDRKTSNFIGFGDPVYDHENFKLGKTERGIPDPVKGNEIKEIHRGKYDREGGQWIRLKNSGEEVKAIAGLFSKNAQKAVVHLREKATEKNARAADMKSFDYIHFSCHGILGDGFQGLVLSQIPGSKEDGYLTRNEIMNCDYNARLVVLSACQTGKGKMERAEGVTGLTRAVMYAGTPAVVASLWNVSEMGTKELMVKFYTNMLEKGMSKEEALRQAKLEMIKDGKYASPYFWSAFVMYGE